MARPRQASTVAAADSAPSVGAPFCWPMPGPAKPRIDLLRAGERPSLAGPLPEAPYFIILSRAERRPIAEVWPLHLQEPLPILPVPLLPPAPDVPLDLGRALATIYDRSGYDLRIDYTQRPPAPALSAEDGTWLEAHLHTAGKRA